MVIILFCFIVMNVSNFKCEEYIIKTNGTKIIGRKLYTVFENKSYAAFWKIPYAQPPVGVLRFKPTVLRPWFTETFYNYSVLYNESCASYYTEDCLYLSLFIPITDSILSYPIIVWINEDSHTHGPDFLIDEGVAVAIVSFRTSIFGFLNTGDNFAEGNMGAKDVLAALRWIRDNIHYFKGDLNRVTVFGSDNMANIVASMLLSFTSEDLFNRVIIQDGSALSPVNYKNYNFEIANKLYWKLLGPFEKFNRTHFYEILKKKSMKQLFLSSQDLFDSTEVRDNQRLIQPFGPTIETSGYDRFMTKMPFDQYKSKNINNDVEVMIGYTNLNSLYKVSGFVENRKLLKYLNYNFQYLLPFEGRKDEYRSKLYQKIRKKIMNFYFVNGTIVERSLRRYVKYLSDQVIYPALRQARLHSEVSSNNVYVYRFAFKGSFNRMWNSLLRNLTWSGAMKGDVICYQFKCKSVSHLYNTETSPETLLIKKIARLFANFAKHGNPTPNTDDNILGDLKWTSLVPYTNIKGLNFGKKLKMITVPEEKRMKFWDQLREEYFSDITVNN